ncbi:hypothetical protein JHK87_023070 [Glycine soja]|nr:hypothetical protein JHK87_023070 [Glycine soja]
MASTLPNMRLYFDFLQQNHKFPNDNLLHLSTRNRTFCNNAKSMAGGEASLQRSKHHQQLQPKIKRARSFTISSKDCATNDRHNGKDCGASLGLQLQFTLHSCR